MGMLKHLSLWPTVRSFGRCLALRVMQGTLVVVCVKLEEHSLYVVIYEAYNLGLK
jgi:hypothetical protein